MNVGADISTSDFFSFLSFLLNKPKIPESVQFEKYLCIILIPFPFSFFVLGGDEGLAWLASVKAGIDVSSLVKGTAFDFSFSGKVASFLISGGGGFVLLFSFPLSFRGDSTGNPHSFWSSFRSLN
jgi:hypothetical protein